MMSHHINPYDYGPEVLGSTPFNAMADSTWSGTESPYGPTFLAIDGVLDQASGHVFLADLLLLRLLEVGGIAPDRGGDSHAGPGPQARPGACRSPRVPARPSSCCRSWPAPTTTRSCSVS